MSESNGKKHLCILAPPFFSHLMPMLSLARSLLKLGIEITVACSSDFQSMIEEKGFQFVEIRINLNANKGSASETGQGKEEKKRLDDFFEATKQGPVETLSFQMRHRGQDMFANPEEVFQRIREINERLDVDLWMVDQLSYSVTVSLLIMQLPFVTFCPPHPASIPDETVLYGIPLIWPEKLKPHAFEMNRLNNIAEKAESDFNDIVNGFLKRNEIETAKPLRIFALCSDLAVIYNYPDFHQKEYEARPEKLYMGFSYEEEALSRKWHDLLIDGSVKRNKIFISLGTFLSARSDVLGRVIESVRMSDPGALLIVAAGGSVSDLESFRDENTVIEDFLPQKAMLPYVDLVIHHGGVGTFTETLFNGKPAIVLPFSSDQFNVAADVEKHKLGIVLDPNAFSDYEMSEALKIVFGGLFNDSINYWSQSVVSAGPEYAARKLREVFDEFT